jgi:hypothetical protein
VHNPTQHIGAAFWMALADYASADHQYMRKSGLSMLTKTKIVVSFFCWLRHNLHPRSKTVRLPYLACRTRHDRMEWRVLQSEKCAFCNIGIPLFVIHADIARVATARRSDRTKTGWKACCQQRTPSHLFDVEINISNKPIGLTHIGLGLLPLYPKKPTSTFI